MTHFAIIYIAISALMACIVTLSGLKALRRGGLLGRGLGGSSLAAGAATLFYTCSVLFTEYRLSSAFSSLYFVSMDLVVLYLLAYTRELVHAPKTPAATAVLTGVQCYGVFDVLVMLVNPFYEIALTYKIRPGFSFAIYEYNMLLLYDFHLIFCFGIVGAVLVMLMLKAVQVPDEYRLTFILHSAALIAIVIINVIFLFFKDHAIFQNL